ncbi:universal stress protein [Streptomyces sp. NPDC055060]
MTAAERTPIVIGLAADPSRRVALEWGADEAFRRRLPLRLVLARGRPADGQLSAAARRRADRRVGAPRGTAEGAVREAVAFVRDRHPCLDVSTLLADDAPVVVLREQSRSAAAVVVGSRPPAGRGGAFAAPPVALPVIRHAACPVVVVREPAVTRHAPPYIVVGVDVGWDGRRHPAAAVVHALDAAARCGAAVRVLYVWHPPLLGVLDERAALRECRVLLADMVAGWRTTRPDVDLRHAVLRGDPARMLARESAHALALVVGAGGHGPRNLSGPVVARVLRHVPCPVVAVPRPVTYLRPLGRPGAARLVRGARTAVGRYARRLPRARRA